jgi:hypothetical protein
VPLPGQINAAHRRLADPVRIGKGRSTKLLNDQHFCVTSAPYYAKSRQNVNKKAALFSQSGREFLTGQDLGLDHAFGICDLVHHLFQRYIHIHSLSRDGYNSAAVGRYDGIDGLDICLMLCKDAQQRGKQTLPVMEHELEGDDSAVHHVLELKK